MIAALQACQANILIKSNLFVNGLFAKSIFHSKCHIPPSFAMQIGWDILLKYTWDFFALPWHTNLIGLRRKEDGWRLSVVCCQGTRRGWNVALYLREMSPIRNGSSHMDLNPDTTGILINKLHTGRDVLRGLHKQQLEEKHSRLKETKQYLLMGF